ncbi:hypothetical protein KI387_035637 [Taxus chinensis]|uniref:AAA+ ATPase domain-containing protein n=1 Tax=Taxus chinensis TaxID=29808 RepID=A0AA38FNX4_TAXCH|nr:hypothetical protein KI387_035637 [Taxus chinensis]
MVEDVNNLDSLISIIEERLEPVASKNDKGQQNTAAQETGSSSRFASYTDFGKNLVEEVLKRAERNRCTACFKSSFNRETRKVVIDVLKQASQIHSLAAGLCVVGYLLDQIDQISNNRAQSVQLLRYLCAMARHVKQLDDRLPAKREQLSQAVDFIFKGCLLCLRVLKSQRLSRLFRASVDAGDLQNLESQIKHNYQDLTLGVVIGVLDNMPQFHPPTQGEDPSAVGIEEAKYEVIRLLKMDPMDESKRAVVLYGVGGVGKTTLASSVLKSLDLKGYKFCRLDMDHICSSDHIKQLQQQILGDLFGKRISLRSSVDGENELAKAFREASDEAIFMFIDNALAQSDLTKLLPQDLSCLPRRIRMLLTTRRVDQTNILLRTDFHRCEFRVDSLSSFDSKKLLRKIVLGSADASFPEGIESRDVDEIVEICGGIPLTIELVGPKLKRCIFNDGSAVKALKESLKETLMEGEGSEMSERVVDSVFTSVAKMPSSMLFAFLLKRGDMSIRKLSQMQSDRILDLESLKDAVQDKKLPASLRFVSLTFNSPNLPTLLPTFGNLSLLEILYLQGCDVLVTLPTSIAQLKSLTCLDLSECSNLTTLPETFGNLSALQLLYLSECSKLATLPPTFGQLKSLVWLQMDGCSKLATLPPTFGQLQSLVWLNMDGCEAITTLPNSFGNLSALIILNLNRCSNLSSLPESFSQLSCFAIFEDGWMRASDQPSK